LNGAGRVGRAGVDQKTSRFLWVTKSLPAGRQAVTGTMNQCKARFMAVKCIYSTSQANHIDK
jgi:hypothetical protein